jgi:hypothetical protein
VDRDPAGSATSSRIARSPEHDPKSGYQFSEKIAL